MSRFAPVFLERPLGNRISQTALRHFAACERSGYLAVKHRDSIKTSEMVRGSAVHLVHERAVKLMLENGEPTIPPEVVKDLADVVLSEMPVPWVEHDSIREMCWRMGSELAVDPESVVATETLFALDVPDGNGEMWEVRCRIDFAEVLDHGARVHVEDLKSSKAAATQEEISRKRKDGSLSAKAFQLILYAIALVYGVPVREDRCVSCGGGGLVALTDVDVDRCEECNGKGRIETREPFPVAARASTFDLEFVYPAIEDSAGKMFRRSVTLTRSELEQYRASLAGLIARLARAEASGDWPAVVSDAACGECPASAKCPIVPEVKDHRGTINTPEECAEALEVREREKKVSAAKSKEITAFVKTHGPVAFGGGMVAEIAPSVSQEIRDKDGMLAAMDVSVRFGEPFDRAQWVKEKVGSRLQVRALRQDEIDSEGSNE